MRTPWILFPILLMPLAEIAGFVVVGRAIGVWSTLGLVILSGVAGILLLRRQGLHMLRQVSAEGRQGRVPGGTMIHGAMIVVAALLLLVPGFISDIIGLLLFIPAIRQMLWSAIGRRVVVSSTTYSQRYERDAGFDPGTVRGGVVDLEEEEFTREPNPASPWTERRLKDE